MPQGGTAINCAGFTFDKFCCLEFSVLIISGDSVTKHSADFHSTPWNEIVTFKRNIKWEILLTRRATAEITTENPNGQWCLDTKLIN